MSSLQESVATVSLDDKRKSGFFSCDSFDKFQITAFYSIQLAGSLLSQKALLQIFEAMVYKSRVILQKVLVLLSLPTFKMAYAVALFWIDTFTRYTGINVAFEKKVVTSANVVIPEKTYILRVQKRKITPRMTDDKAIDMKISNTSTRTEKESPTDSLLAVERKNSIGAIDLAAHQRLTNLWRSDSDSEMGSNASISNRQNVGMVVIVYGSATLVYIQLMLLAVFLQTATTPPGLLFLVSSLAFIGYIALKISFVKAKTKDDTAAANKLSSSAYLSKKKPDDASLPQTNTKQARLSRWSTRRFLYFHNKTLSKIKLL